MTIKDYGTEAHQILHGAPPAQIHILNHGRIVPDQRASYAMELMKLMAVAVVPYEASNKDGSQAMRQFEPAEAVKRAIDMADQLYKALDKKGWLGKVPTFQELLKEAGPPVGFAAGLPGGNGAGPRIIR
jgi:hypothetical protein